MMDKTKKKVIRVCSLSDFDRRFYPKSASKINLNNIDDPEILGSKLAARSLRKIKQQLLK